MKPESIILKSLHDIRQYDTTQLEKGLLGWKRFAKIDFDHVKGWHISITLCILGLIATIVLWQYCKNFFSSSGTSVTIELQDRSHNRAPDLKPEYPVFGA